MAKKDYSSLSKEDLLNVLEQIEAKKKYGLVWDEERVPEKVVAECRESLPVLTEDKHKAINSNEQDITHLLIEGDNFHALSVLNYTHKGKIDLIYIDPPYNTGSKDWKYNNDYVDENDTWRHSKWIQFMFNRLTLAKNLLTEDGALIVAIDHNEQENLGILLREMFGNKEVTCISIVHNPRGIQGNNFSYTHENAYFVYPKGDFISPIKRSEEDYEWENLRNWGGDSERKDGKSMFFPIVFKNNILVEVGSVPSDDFHPEAAYEVLDNDLIKLWPIDNNGIERKWRYSIDSLSQIKNKVRLEKIKDYYQAQLLKDTDRPKTVWTDSKYDANIYGTQLLAEIIDAKFPFPKSLFTVKECIETVVKNKPNALILDFFAGSGTTGHAVLEINKEHGGHRKFILCTNNESNICSEVTYPRIQRCISGYDFKGKVKEILLEKKINFTLIKRGNIFAQELEKLAEEHSAKYSEIKKEINGQFFRLIGIKDIDGRRDGYGGNLRFFRAAADSFVKQNANKDQLRIDVSQRCTEMLCLKEDIYNLVDEDINYKIFKQGQRYLAIYYDFGGLQLEQLKKRMNEFYGDKILYCFTLDPQGLDITNFADWENIRIEPIPQKILDVYKRIFKIN